MSVEVSRSVEKELLRRIAAADSVFCFLDYDGTLSPLAPTPAEAVALPGTSALILELARPSLPMRVRQLGRDNLL